MIAQISGKILQKKEDRILLENNGICYEVLMPPLILARIDSAIGEDGNIRLITYHYLQVEPSKSVPIIVGFINEIEKEFFELFITVSGIGPRAAIRAIKKPISEIAKAINDGDEAFLNSLPGIGKQRAKEIIAKLQNKIAKFGLIKDSLEKIRTPLKEDLEKEVLEILLQLQYKKQEAKDMINKALERTPSIETPEELLGEVYRQRKR